MKKCFLILVFFLITCSTANADFTDCYNAGQQYLAAYQYSSAITEFKKALRINYLDNSARVGIINSYLARGTYLANKDRNWELAANDFRAALFYMKYYPEDEDVQNASQSIANATKNLNLCLNVLKFNPSGKSHFNKAKQLRLNGYFPEAGYEFAQSVTDSSVKADAYEEIADIMNVLGNDEKTLDYYKKSISLNSDNAELRLKYARILDKLGKSDDAIEQYNYALANGGDNPEILYALERYYRQKIALAPNDAPTLTSLGAILQKENKLDEALDFYSRAAQYDPSNVTTRLDVGTLYQQKQDYDKALSAYNSILLIYPDNTQALLFKAQCLAAQGNNQDALAAFNTVLRLEPTNKAAKAQVIETLKKTMTPAEIIAYLQQNNTTDSNTINDLYDYAVSLHRQKKFDEAIAYYKEILKVKTDNPEIYENLAIAYQQKNDNESAKKVLLSAKAKFPNNKQISDNINAITTQETNDIYDAAAKAFDAKDFQKALDVYQSIQPADFDSLSGIAACYKELNQDENAIEYYKKALSIHANSDTAYYIGEIYSEKENWNDAKIYLKKALEINPKNKNAKDLLTSIQEQDSSKLLDDAIALYEKNDYAKAMPIFNKILAENPKNAYAYYYRGLINDSYKKYQIAILDYKKALLYNSKDLGLVNYLLALDYDSVSQFKNALIHYKKYVAITAENNEYKQYSQTRIKELRKYETN